MLKFPQVLSEERYGRINPELRKTQMKPASKTCYLNPGCWEATKLRNCLLEIHSEPVWNTVKQVTRKQGASILQARSKNKKLPQHNLKENNSVSER